MCMGLRLQPKCIADSLRIGVQSCNSQACMCSAPGMYTHVHTTVHSNLGSKEWSSWGFSRRTHIVPEVKKTQRKTYYEYIYVYYY